MGPPTSFLFLVMQMWMLGCHGSKSEERLIKHLMKGYNPAVRPVDKNGDVVKVDFQLSLQQIVDLDEKNQLMSTSLYMNNAWQDTHFQWDPADYDGLTTIRLPAKQVWKPDIFVYNSAVDSFDSLLQTNVIITNDTWVSWLPPGIFKTTCDVDIQYFPFDQQRCQIKFGSWTHQENSLDISLMLNGTADISAYQESGAWDLISMSGKVNREKYDCCADRFVDATYTIVLRRKSAFYVYNLVVPCVLVCSLTILTFIFPADAGERMTLGITVLLAMVVFLQIVADNLPPTGATPLLGKYFLCTVFMVSLSVVMSVLSMSLHHSDSSNTHGMPTWVGERLGGYRNESCDGNGSVTGLAKHMKQSEQNIAKMCGDLHDIVTRMKDDAEDNEVTLKWKFTARVMDRFCLVFFIIFFLASTVLTLGSAPNPDEL